MASNGRAKITAVIVENARKKSVAVACLKFSKTVDMPAGTF